LLAFRAFAAWKDTPAKTSTLLSTRQHKAHRGCTGPRRQACSPNFGPQIKIRIKRVQPFFEGLVGGAHTNFYQNVHKNCPGCTSGSPGDWALDVVLGGGVDIKVTSHLAIRPIEADYFLTRFINNLTSGNNKQN
jgi:hypothetical protein